MVGGGGGGGEGRPGMILSGGYWTRTFCTYII